MKWIGQFIYDQIARFRDDIYLEDVSTGTIASGGNLGLDSNNKIVKATVSSGSGDITGVTLAGDSGSASDTSANVDLTIAGGNAITTSGSSTTITINHDDTSSQASVDNSGSTYIQDVTLDTYGHVTGLTSAAIPTLNQNTTGSSGSCTGQAATVATITGLAPDTATTQAAQANITSLGTLTVLQVDDINLNTKTLKITGDTDDTFAVTAGANGATTLATLDNAGTAGHLTLDPDGDIILDTAGATINNGIILKTNGTQFGDFNVHHSNSYLTLYEAGGTSLTDYLQISVAAAGATTITTVDAGGATAHLDFAIDGHFSVASTGIDIATDGTITNATWEGTAIATSHTAAKVTSIVAGDGIDVSGATGDVTVTAETASDSNPGVVELATTAEAVTGTDTARAVTPAGLKARVSQIINLKGYAVLQNDVYDYANPFNTDDEAPFQLDVSYGSGTIDSSTEVGQSKLFRSGGFHVPFACTVSDIQAQITCNNAGNVSIALVEYKPSSASGDQNDYPRTVYETVVVASANSNNKVSSTTIATADLDSTAVPAGSHLMIMVKGDGTSAGGTAIISVAVGLSW
tara:strand:+ start:916 stop:2649 length:1734 start_codon:yes stop_codon:yes gene_type:complete